MKLIVWALPAAVLLLVSAAGEQAHAQGGGLRPYANPYGSPTFSPYLNLLNRNTNPAITYYGIVRPEVQTYNALGRLQGDVTANATSIDSLQSGGLVTGHKVQFLNTTHYFMNVTGAGGQGQARAGSLTQSIGTGATAQKPQSGAQQPKK